MEYFGSYHMLPCWDAIHNLEYYRIYSGYYPKLNMTAMIRWKLSLCGVDEVFDEREIRGNETHQKDCLVLVQGIIVSLVAFDDDSRGPNGNCQNLLGEACF